MLFTKLTDHLKVYNFFGSVTINIIIPSDISTGEPAIEIVSPTNKQSSEHSSSDNDQECPVCHNAPCSCSDDETGDGKLIM